MTNLTQEIGLQEQRSKVEKMVRDVVGTLQTRYHVPVPKLCIVWREFTTSVATVEGNNLLLSKLDFVTMPYDIAARNTPVTLRISTPSGEMPLTFPYGRILDLLCPPQVQTPSALNELSRPPMSDGEMRGEITTAIVASVISQQSGWLSEDQSNARCLRNGIVSSYQHLLAGSKAVDVSERIWIDDDDVQRWRESDGGFHLLYPHLKDSILYYELIEGLEASGPPGGDEKLPDYITRALAL